MSLALNIKASAKFKMLPPEWQIQEIPKDPQNNNYYLLLLLAHQNFMVKPYC